MPKARSTSARASSSATLSPRCRINRPRWSSIAAVDSDRPWSPTLCKRWVTPQRFRSTAAGGRGTRPRCPPKNRDPSDLSKRSRAVGVQNFVHKHVNDQAKRAGGKERDHLRESRIHEFEPQQERERQAAVQQDRIHVVVARVREHHRDRVKQQRHVAVIPFLENEN